MSQPWIYINGYPGIEKLTIAKELEKLIGDAKILDNHRLIDPVAAVFDRSMPEYQPLRRQIRQTILNSIAESKSIEKTTWIFTDQRPSSGPGASAAQDYQRVAALRGAPFISIVLHCSMEENLRRLNGTDRGGQRNTKLLDPDILRYIRATEDLYHFDGILEKDIDITDVSPSDAGILDAKWFSYEDHSPDWSKSMLVANLRELVVKRC